MARGTEIIVSSEPRGRFTEGIISGTPKPGTIMELLAATAPVGGRFTWRASTRSTGAKGAIAVLLPDNLQGKLATDAYVTLTRGFLYFPVAGEELNLLVADVAGTADDVAIGALFGVETTTGKLKADSSYGSAPFQALEAITDPAADYLLWCMYLGNQA